MPPSEISTRTARLYMRPDGIVVSANRPNVGEQTLADAMENIRAVAALSGGARVPLYIDSTAPTSIAADARKYYLSEESSRHVSAVAIVAGNVLSRVIANLLIPVQRQPVPMQLFATEREALEWLRWSKVGRKT
jgi:hypothetical protein